MSTVKHTPGPWHVGKDHEAGIGRGYFVAGDGCVRVDLVGPTQDQESNARLIAAAPDLLACLKDARTKLTDQSEIDLAYIDDVIAKAEGRA